MEKCLKVNALLVRQNDPTKNFHGKSATMYYNVHYYNGIFKIGKIRKLLDWPTTAKLTHIFVSSHLDYCNSIFSGLPHSYLLPLQRIQNTAARLVYTLSRKSEHITPILRSLHLLPIHHRITFKVLLLTYKILHGQAPKYLSDLISLRCSNSLRPLRSSTLQLTLGPHTITRYGDRAFSVIALILWNKLPAHIHNTHSLDQFKTLLKTHLFNS